MKAYMIRKADSVEDWEAAKECINCYSGEKAKREIVVEKTITLTPTEFVAFCDMQGKSLSRLMVSRLRRQA